MELSAQIEALLFFRGEPISRKEIAKLLNEKEDAVNDALTALTERLSGRGVQLIQKDAEVMLTTARGASELIEKIRKEELTRPLGKAGAETLSIVLYRGPSTRAEIDYIRGVNSTFILRNLLIRGLVERVANPKDQRSFVYAPTFELLSNLGITRIEELPEWSGVRTELEKYMHEHTDENKAAYAEDITEHE